jgi:hypothetical protein
MDCILQKPGMKSCELVESPDKGTQRVGIIVFNTHPAVFMVGVLVV